MSISPSSCGVSSSSWEYWSLHEGARWGSLCLGRLASSPSSSHAGTAPLCGWHAGFLVPGIGRRGWLICRVWCPSLLLWSSLRVWREGGRSLSGVQLTTSWARRFCSTGDTTHHVLGKEVLLHRRHHGGSPRMVCAAMRVSWVSSDRFVPHLPSGGWSPPVRPSCVLLDAVPLGLLSCPSSPPQCASQAHHGVEWGQVSSHLLDLRRVSLRAGEPACRALSLPPRHRWQVLGGVRYTLRSLLCGHVCGLREEVVLGFAPLGVLRALSPWP